MKTRIILLLSIFFSLGGFSQNPEFNWIKTTSYKQPYTISELPENPEPNQAVVQVGYFDGFGRNIQSIAYKQNPDGNNIVYHNELDAFGRNFGDFLPYIDQGNNLQPISELKEKIIDFYNTDSLENTLNPYNEILYENSPLSRVIKTATPGTDWKMGSGQEIKYKYTTNIENEVLLYKVNLTWDETKKLYNTQLLQTTTYFEQGQLYKKVIQDEHSTQYSQNASIEYTDKNGRTVLKRQRANINTQKGTSPVYDDFDTYFVYDKFGNLTYVIPPNVQTENIISASDINELCYQYKYDKYSRMVARKLPGKTWEYFVYDKLDRLRASGPVLSPFTNTGQGWIMTKYDIFNRPVITGFIVASNINETTRLTLQNNIENADLNEQRTADSNTVTTVNGVQFNYTNLSYPASGYHILTINYYDDYNYKNAPTDFSQIYGQQILTNTKGLPTGTAVRILEASTQYKFDTSHILYKNDRMRSPIRQRTSYYSGGFLQIDSEVRFSGEVIKTETKHKKNATTQEIQITENFNYSPQGHLLSRTHRIDEGQTETLSENIYDALGRLYAKKVGKIPNDINPLQTVNFKYNIRGWLTEMNDMENMGNDLFSFRIRYNNPDSNQSMALYNGNISETQWKTDEDTEDYRMFSYYYDGLNRLKEAKYTNTGEPLWADAYNETLTYDKNGNLQTLLRKGPMEGNPSGIPIDNLVYIYDPQSSNRLKKVVDLTNSIYGFKDDSNGTLASDPVEDYSYDAFGNMTQDQNKNITTITYNHLNLPMRITFSHGGIVQYTYTAQGTKTKKTVTTATTISTTEYLSGFQYNNDMLQFFPHAEGYVNNTIINNTNHYNYVYQYTDHVGNIRMSYTWDEDTQSVTKMESTDYYPYGLPMIKESNTEKRTFVEEQRTVVNPDGSTSKIGVPVLKQVPNSGFQYKYNGKEWQDEFGLNMYSMDVRQFDPAIARWVVQDPIVHLALSPYQGYNANPVYFADPSGADVGWDRYEKELIVKHSQRGASVGRGLSGSTNNFLGSGIQHQDPMQGKVVGTFENKGNGVYQNTVTGETTTDADYALRYNCVSQGGGCSSEVFSGDTLEAEPGTEYLDEVTINVRDPGSYQRAANKITADIESWGWHQRMRDEASNGGVDANDYIDRTNLFYTGLGIIGSYKYKTGRYVQTNGKIGNFHNVKSANAKANLNFAKGLRTIGKGGNILSFGAIAYDVLDDGNIKSSTVVNSALLMTSILFPPTAIVVLGYGIGDYFFDFSGKIDNKYGEINTGLYE